MLGSNWVSQIMRLKFGIELIIIVLSISRWIARTPQHICYIVQMYKVSHCCTSVGYLKIEHPAYYHYFKNTTVRLFQYTWSPMRKQQYFVSLYVDIIILEIHFAITYGIEPIIVFKELHTFMIDITVLKLFSEYKMHCILKYWWSTIIFGS